MDRGKLLEHVAPCSLLCYTCGGYKDGIMSQLSNNLLHYTEGVYEFYAKHLPTNNQAELKQFEVFRRTLQQRSDARCEGCRNGNHNGCSIKGCFINKCVLEHGVDFCGECPNFPCSKTRDLFEEEIYQQWLDGNQHIKEIGVRQFYEINKKRSHYAAYIKKYQTG